MNKKVGVWIDHKEAVLVMYKDEFEEVRLIHSNVERHRSRSSSISHEGSYESQAVKADDSQQRRFTGKLNIYYDAVIDYIHDAERILILGPGEAKGELMKRLERKVHTHPYVSLITASKMTQHQIVAYIREYYVAEKRKQVALSSSDTNQSADELSLYLLFNALRMA
jgi:stalled ribosome rescue protein Dom34